MGGTRRRVFWCWRVLLLLGMMGVVGCAHAPVSPPGISWKDLDTTPLQGKRIVLDPGHGGRFAGARGPYGLRESEVNLAVALTLWGMLRAAGAEVILTRTTDVDLSSQDPPMLREDLQARVRMTCGADLLISIHHNADTRHPWRDGTEFYYRMADPRASRDLAASIARAFQEHLGIPMPKVLPGNYHVLRNTGAVAILGEAAYLTNPKQASRLALYASLRQEAEAYFLGILQYFRRGVPEVEYPGLPLWDPACREPGPPGTAPARSQPTAHPRDPQFLEARVRVPPGVSLDPQSLQLLLDGRPVPFLFVPETGVIRHRLQSPLTNGEHTLEVRGATLEGRWIPPRITRFRVHRPPARIQIHLPWDPLPAWTGIPLRIRVAVQDRHGFPVGEGYLLQVSPNPTGSPRTVLLRQGRGTFYWTLPDPRKGGPTLRFQVARVQTFLHPTWLSSQSREAVGYLLATVRGMGEVPLEGVVLRAGEKILDTSDARGHLYLQHPPGLQEWTLEAPGYHPSRVQVALAPGRVVFADWTLVPVDPVLLGHSVVLDLPPRDAWSQRIVERLATRLRRAGVQVFIPEGLQREDIAARVLFATRKGGVLLLSLASVSGREAIGHYDRSEKGKHLALALARQLGIPTRESTHPLVVHTPMPAVQVPLVSTWQPEAVVEALYAGIRTYLASLEGGASRTAGLTP